MSHVPVPSQELSSSVCLCDFCSVTYAVVIIFRKEHYYFMHTRYFIWVDSELYSVLVEGLMATSRYVSSSVFLGVGFADSLTFAPYLFIFITDGKTIVHFLLLIQSDFELYTFLPVRRNKYG